LFLEETEGIFRKAAGVNEKWDLVFFIDPGHFPQVIQRDWLTAAGIIGDGDADILLGFEPLETYRSINKVSKKTIVITNTRPIYPFTVIFGQSRYIDIDYAMAEVEKFSSKLYCFDAQAVASEAGSARSVNIVLLGFLAGLGILPVSKDRLWSAVEGNLPEKLHEINRKAFDAGFEMSEKN